jgi:hypothetical protein
MTRRSWCVAGVVAALLLGCSGMTGEEAVPPPVQPMPIPPPVMPAPGQLPTTGGWREHRLQNVRLGMKAPDGWTVTDDSSSITVKAPGGGTARITDSATCGEQIETKRSAGTPVFDEPGRFVVRTPPAADGSTRCGVVAGRTLGDHVWCAVADETAAPPFTDPECLTVAAMVMTIEEPPGKSGSRNGGGRKSSKRPQ